MAACEIDRRSFLSATSSAGFTLAFALPAALRPGNAEAAAATAVNTWLTVGTDNAITLRIGASDMGQGSVQGLAQVLAEDLMVDPARVTIVQGGPTLVAPAPLGSAILTAGSSVTRNNFWRLRDAGAIARETLVSAAMMVSGDSARSNYAVANGVVQHLPTGGRWTYGDLAATAARLTPPASAPLVPDAQFRSIGKPMLRQDIPSKVDGSARYGLDVRLPGMVFAAVRHCPTFGGRLAATPAKPSGAMAVVPLTVAPGTGRGADAAGSVNAFAVVAATTWDAMRLARGTSARWTLPAAAAAWNSAQFATDAKALLAGGTPYAAGAANGPGTLFTVEAVGTPDAALTAPGARVVDATYTLPYLSHACMEVLNCTVDYVAGVRCDVYAPTQVARSALQMVVTLTGLPESQVRVHTTLLGGGLGRKAEIDFIAQAVQVGMALGRPVQLVWSREEDFTHDQYRPMAVVRARAALDAANNVSGWVYRNVSPSILGQRGAVLPATGDGQAWEGSAHLPYALPAKRVEWVSHTAPIPVGFWRSVGASINTFAVESMVDELAWAAGQDPYRFRRARLSDPRWLAVLDTAAKASAFAPRPAAGIARGIAVGAAFNTIVATVVEVSGTSATSFTIRRVWVVVDPYLVVNPLNAEAQITGGVVHAINATLYGQQTFTNGAAQRRNFNTNPVIQLQKMPQVSVTFMPPPAQADRTVAIGGIGELGVPTFAPALANALYALLGTRVRNLPLLPGATMSD